MALRFLPGPREDGGSTAESLLYVNGVPLQDIGVWHEEAWLPREFLQKDELLVALKVWSGVLEVPERRRFKAAQLIWIDEPAECFYYLARTLYKAVKAMDENDLRRRVLLQALDESFGCLDFARPGSARFYQSTQAAGETLEAHLAQSVSRHLAGFLNSPSL